MHRLFTKLGRILTIAAIALFCTQQARALVAGDLVFTSFDATGVAGTDAFTFVLLTPIPGGTVINFTDRGHTGGGVFVTATASTETAIQFTSSTVYAAGTEIKIVGFTATVVSTGLSAGTVSGITSPAGTPTLGLSLSALDQVIAYQGTLESSPTIIAGLHWNNCPGNTTDATWDPTGGACSFTGQAGSNIPPGISPSTGSFWTGLVGTLTPTAGYFNCSAGTPFATAASVRTAVLNKANWTFSTSSPSGLTTPNGCTYIGVSAPTITVNPGNQTVCAGTNSTGFTVAATGSGTLTYQWQVSTTGTGGTYTNISNGTNYSNVQTATLTVNNAPATFNGYAYRAAVINSGGTTYSAGAVLTVENGVPTIGAQPSDATICPGGTTIFSGSATGGTITYKWQVNTGSGFTNITDGGVYSNSGTTSLTITGAAASMYGYQYRLTATNSCGTSNSNAATLTFRTTWNGSTSNAWNTASNWSCNVVPDANTDVIIPNVATQPVVSTTTSLARNVTINLGASITIAANSTLTVSGDVSNLGNITATATGATLAFNSAGAQFIPAGTFYNISVAGGGNKTLAGNVTINNNITFTSGKIYLGSSTLTMASTAGTPNTSSTNWIVTNGTGGYKKLGLGSSGIVFGIGTATDYTPFLLSNAGTTDNFTGRVIDGVYNSYSSDVPSGSAIASNVVNKTWFITEDVTGGSNASLTVQWNGADELSPFNRAACYLAHYVGTKWQDGVLGASSPSTGAGPYTKVLTGITAFSPFGVGGVGSPLPVKLVSISGRPVKGGNSLAWATANEQNMDGFHIERSDDGRSFSEIGYVKAAASANGGREYSFLDQTASAAARQYYRLNMTSLDGSHEYSQTISIAAGNTAANLWTASPNPVTGDDLYLQPAINSGDAVEISIADVSGRVWYYSTGNAAQATALSLKAIPAGIYVLKLKTGTSVQAIKLVRR